MAHARQSTPLIAIDAVVIDIETTGLDPKTARVVELASVRLSGGRLDEAKAFRRLVNPGMPIPAAASDIHGISDAAVAGALPFAPVWSEFSQTLGDAVLIGHTVGFDLAVLKRECERAGFAWMQPPTLDTRLLAEIAEPALARKPRRLARTRDHRPPYRARRCALRRTNISGSPPEATPKQRTDISRGRAGLPRANQGSGRTSPCGMGGGGATDRRG